MTPFIRLFFPVKVYGRENIPKDGAFILCCNHVSNVDPFHLGIICKRQVYFMAKIELFRIPVLRSIVRKVGAFAVDRGKGDTSAIEHAEDLIRQGHIMGIFPEGTRYKTGAPRKAKSGIAYIAMATQADILPASLHRTNGWLFFRKTTLRFGERIPYSELVVEGDSDRANMRRITERVTAEITKLWEMGH